MKRHFSVTIAISRGDSRSYLHAVKSNLERGADRDDASLPFLCRTDLVCSRTVSARRESMGDPL
jgi:hypothetical protein